jgi:hypothetical protein
LDIAVSALVAVRKSQSVEILADKTSVFTDGVIAAIESKIIVLRTRQNLICVLGVLGWTTPGLMFADYVSERFTTFDGLIGHAQHAWREHRKRDVPSSDRYSVLIAGWSDKRQRAEAYSANNDDDDGVFDFGSVMAEAATDAAICETQGLGIPHFQALRRYTADLGCGPVRTVGGELEHWIITRTGIVSRIIHRWPDRVGRHIEAA